MVVIGDERFDVRESSIKSLYYEFQSSMTEIRPQFGQTRERIKGNIIFLSILQAAQPKSDVKFAPFLTTVPSLL